MFAVCHGESEGGGTHVPSGLQGNIQWIAVGRDTSCAVVNPASDVVCWGTSLPPPPVSCSGTATATQVFVWENTSLSQMNGAILCSNQSVMMWNSSASTSVTSVTHVSSSPSNLCYVVNSTATCLNSNSRVPVGLAGFASKSFAGDAGACIQLKVGTNSLSCFGSYSSFSLAQQTGQTLLDADLSGPVACMRWSNGWLCTSTNNSPAANSLAQLWPLISSQKSTGPVALGSLSVWSEFANSQGVLCAVDPNTKQVWCQGSGYGLEGDTSNAVFLMNAETTVDAQMVAVGPTHICALVQGQTTPWAWIVIFGFIALFLIAIWLAWRHYTKEIALTSFRTIKTL